MSLVASGRWGNSGGMSREGEGEVGRDVKLGPLAGTAPAGCPTGVPGWTGGTSSQVDHWRQVRPA